MGYLQLTPDLFYDMTYEELQVMAKARREQDEIHIRMAWEQARFIAFRLSAPYFKKGSKPTPQSFHRFPWDDKQAEAKPVDMEKINALRDEVRREIEQRKLKIA